jgi:hypothetical protein
MPEIEYYEEELTELEQEISKGLLILKKPRDDKGQVR